jgi:hypothetical protein
MENEEKQKKILLLSFQSIVLKIKSLHTTEGLLQIFKKNYEININTITPLMGYSDKSFNIIL